MARFLVFTDICLQNVNQLSTYGLIQTDEDGYILRPLGRDLPLLLVISQSLG